MLRWRTGEEMVAIGAPRVEALDSALLEQVSVDKVVRLRAFVCAHLSANVAHDLELLGRGSLHAHQVH